MADRPKGLNKGRYLLLVKAIRPLVGELRIDPLPFALSLQAREPPGLSVDGAARSVVRRLAE